MDVISEANPWFDTSFRDHQGVGDEWDKFFLLFGGRRRGREHPNRELAPVFLLHLEAIELDEVLLGRMPPHLITAAREPPHQGFGMLARVVLDEACLHFLLKSGYPCLPDAHVRGQFRALFLQTKRDRQRALPLDEGRGGRGQARRASVSISRSREPTGAPVAVIKSFV